MEDMVDFWRGKRVFLTGHTGFKGRWLTAWLSHMGALVDGYSLPNDVRDAYLLRKAVERFAPEIVFHLAAQALVRPSYADPLATFAVNVQGTANLLEAVRHCGSVKATVVVTSDKCYADGPNPHVEQDTLGGVSPYSASKSCAEIVAASYRDAYAMSIATARAGNVIGGGDWGVDRLIPDIVRGDAVIRNPSHVRPWQHVLDCLRGYLMLAESLHGSDVFTFPWNFGPSENEDRTVRWVAERVSAALGVPLRFEPQFKAPMETQVLRLNASKALTGLGWETSLGTEEAVDWTIEWYKAWKKGTDLTLDHIRTYEQRLKLKEAA